MADAARDFAAATGAHKGTRPGSEPARIDLQRYLAMSTRPDATGKCGTATVGVNDHHVGRALDAAAGWIDFNYHRQGRQDIPPSNLAAAPQDRIFVDTSPHQVDLCGSRFALDRERNLYHLQISGINASVRTLRTDMPQLPAVPVRILGDGELRLLFLNKPGGGKSVSIAPFEIRNLYYVTGTQGQKFPVDARISWSVNVAEDSL
jgi:hypothetical protein